MAEPDGAAPAAAAGRFGSGTAVTSRVLIVDDSEVVRRLLRLVIDGEPDFEIVGEASDGQQAMTQIRALRPDVVVLDLHMPGMDGFGVLAAIEAERLATRVVVFANVEDSDRDRIDRVARDAGAELVSKPTGVAGVEEAVAGIRSSLLEALRRGVPRPRQPRPGSRRVVNAVVIASSTGGPNALEVVLGNISDLRVPIFIVQHIAGGFSGRLAERLNTLSPFPVHEVVDRQRPQPGHAYVGPGGIHLTVERDDEGPIMRLRDSPPVNSCRPSADVLFRTSAEVYGGNQLAVVLTGIGRDGLDGCRVLASRGAAVLVQDEATSVVWGMPGAVAENGLADEILPIESIAGRIQALASLGQQLDRSQGAGR